MQHTLRKFLPWALGLAVVVAAPMRALAADAPTVAKPERPGLSAFRAVGMSFGKSSRLSDLGWSEAEFAAFADGVRAAYRGETIPPDASADQLFAEMGRRVKEVEARERQKQFADPRWQEKYMQETCKKMRLQQSDSGLGYGVANLGKGVRPAPEDTVVISVEVGTYDGASELPQLKLDRRRCKVSELLPGLAEGVQMLTLDSQGMFVVPAALSYGQGEWPAGVERGSPLLYLVKLHEVISAP